MTLFADPDLERRYREAGWVVVPMLDPAEAASLAAEAEMPEDLRRPWFTATLMSRDLEARRRVDGAIRQAIARRIAELLPDHRIAFCNFAIKPPGTAGAVELHQDWTFVDETLHESVGIWAPLIDADERSGCLRVVSGSHRFGGSPRGFGMPFRWPEAREALTTSLLRPVPMRAGEAMLFSHRLFHASAPNQSEGVRVAAAAVTVPRASRLWYVRQNGEAAEIFDVDDAYYLEFSMGERPPGRDPVRVVAEPAADPLDLDALRAAARS